MSDRLIRLPGATWQEIEALPQPVEIDSHATAVKEAVQLAANGPG